MTQIPEEIQIVFTFNFSFALPLYQEQKGGEKFEKPGIQKAMPGFYSLK
jgi:hypothetical protein